MINPKKITNFGYGGISCPCCTPLNTRKKNKTYSKRRYRQHLKEEQALEEGDFYWYWYRLDPSNVMDEEKEQEYWEQENVEYYRNQMEGRDTMEHSSVYTQNTYEW